MGSEIPRFLGLPGTQGRGRAMGSPQLFSFSPPHKARDDPLFLPLPKIKLMELYLGLSWLLVTSEGPKQPSGPETAPAK